MSKNKVEEKKKNNVKKVEDKVKKDKEKKVVKKVEEKVTCPECGKKYLASLKECPVCGYTEVKKKKTFYDDEEEFEDFDDEDVEVNEEKVSAKPEVKKEEVKEVKKEDNKKLKKEEPKKEKKKEKEHNKKVAIKSNNSSASDASNDIIDFIKIIVIIALLVGIVYLVVALLNKEFDKDEPVDEDEEVTETIQNDKILATSIFKKDDKEYYVFAYNGDDDDHWAVFYSTLYAEYSAIDDKDKKPLYWVDLSDPLNKNVVAENSDDVNLKPSKYEDLSMQSPTLIYIKNGKFVKYYDGAKAPDKVMRMIDSFREKEEDKK